MRKLNFTTLRFVPFRKNESNQLLCLLGLKAVTSIEYKLELLSLAEQAMLLYGVTKL